MLPPKLRSEEYGSLEARYTAKLRQGEKGSWGLTDASGSRMTIRTWVKNKGLLLTGKYKAHRGPVLTGPHRLEIQHQLGCNRRRRGGQQPHLLILALLW
ncbi:hypothetical protein HaLaN_24718 [Haematococcus lacustris]|uniref:Uncharacterized protein n=1 Tax=Haematococcus lacustris TaxID=44745 RepID=A0A699ZZ32_HAELA|nr:hypothetical protein HaLaN_24718 [Haematococcus lacustris]